MGTLANCMNENTLIFNDPIVCDEVLDDCVFDANVNKEIHLLAELAATVDSYRS